MVIHLFQLCSLFSKIEAFQRSTSGRGTELMPQGIVCQQPDDIASQTFHIVLFAEQPCRFVCNGFRNSTNSEACYWQSHRLSLREDQPKTFGSAPCSGKARYAKNLSSIHPVPYLVLAARSQKPEVAKTCRGQLFQLLAERPIANDHKLSARYLFLYPCHCLNKMAAAFAVHQPPGE